VVSVSVRSSHRKLAHFTTQFTLRLLSRHFVTYRWGVIILGRCYIGFLAFFVIFVVSLFIVRVRHGGQLGFSIVAEQEECIQCSVFSAFCSWIAVDAMGAGGRFSIVDVDIIEMLLTFHDIHVLRHLRAFGVLLGVLKPWRGCFASRVRALRSRAFALRSHMALQMHLNSDSGSQRDRSVSQERNG